MPFCDTQSGANAEACNRAVDSVMRSVLDNVRKAMASIAHSSVAAEMGARVVESEGDAQAAVSYELLPFFGSSVEVAPTVDISEGRVEKEVQRWLSKPGVATTNVLRYWIQQAEQNNYKFLPQVARLYFAAPTSSAQVERDFSATGRMVTPQRMPFGPQCRHVLLPERK